MLSPRNRLRRSTDFSLVMRKGRRAGRDSLVVLLFIPPADQRADERTGAEDLPPKVGFIVSKAVGGAVVRNRVQRRLRHLMRDRITVLPPGSLLVVRAKPASAFLGHDALAAQLDGALTSVTRPRRPSARSDRMSRGTATANTPAAGERPIQ